jgi:hypothetical protein
MQDCFDDVPNGEVLERGVTNVRKVLCNRVVDQRYKIEVTEDYSNRIPYSMKRKIRRLKRLHLGYHLSLQLTMSPLEYEHPSKCLQEAEILGLFFFKPQISERRIDLYDKEYWAKVDKKYLEGICSGKIVPTSRLVPINQQ